jgi:hypothetical protein
MKGGIDLIKQAIETDPGLAEGYAALAEAYLLADISFIGDKSIPVEDPLPLVQEILRLDPELSVGYQIGVNPSLERLAFLPSGSRI